MNAQRGHSAGAVLTGTGLSLIQTLIPGSRALVRGSWSSDLLREIKARAEGTLGALSPTHRQGHLTLIHQKANLGPLRELVLYATHKFWALTGWERREELCVPQERGS